MPKKTKKHLRGASEKEQRQYEHIKESAQDSGRYGGRAKEVAARTVMKQRGRKKSKKSASRKSGSSRSGKARGKKSSSRGGSRRKSSERAR